MPDGRYTVKTANFSSVSSATESSQFPFDTQYFPTSYIWAT